MGGSSSNSSKVQSSDEYRERNIFAPLVQTPVAKKDEQSDIDARILSQVETHERDLDFLKGQVLDLTGNNLSVLPKDTYSLPLLVYNTTYGDGIFMSSDKYSWLKEHVPTTFLTMPIFLIMIPMMCICALVIWGFIDFGDLSGLAIFSLGCGTLVLVWFMSPLIAFYALACGIAVLQAFSMRVLVDVTLSWNNIQMADRSLKILVYCFCVLLCATCASDTRDALSLIWLGARACRKDRLLLFLCTSLGSMQLFIIVNLTSLSTSMLTSTPRAEQVILNYLQWQTLVLLDNTVVSGAIFAIPPWVWKVAGFQLESDCKQDGTNEINDPETPRTLESLENEEDEMEDSVNFSINKIQKKLKVKLKRRTQKCTKSSICYGFGMVLPLAMALLVLQEQAIIDFEKINVIGKPLGMCPNRTNTSVRLLPVMDTDLCEGAARQLFHVDRVIKGEDGDGVCVYRDYGHKPGKSTLRLSLSRNHRATHQICAPEYIRVPLTTLNAVLMNFAFLPGVSTLSKYFPFVRLPPNGICAANDLDWIKNETQCKRAQKLLNIIPFSDSRYSWLTWLYRWTNHDFAACLGFDRPAAIWAKRNDPFTPVAICTPVQCPRVRAKMVAQQLRTRPYQNLTYQSAFSIPRREL